MTNPNALFAEAQDAIRASRYADAERALRAMQPLVPDHPLVLSVLGAALRGQGRLGEAAEVSLRAVERAPDNPGVLANCGAVLLESLRLDEAEGVYRRAVAAAPGLVEPRVGLSNALNRLGRLLDAGDVCREGLERVPGDPRLVTNLGAALLFSGRPEEAARVYGEGLARVPDSLALAAGRAYALLNAEGQDAAGVAGAHRVAGAIIRRHVGDHPRPRMADPDPDRVLRVGIVTADLRMHASAFFFAPLFEHTDRGRLRFWFYSTTHREDEVTRRFEAQAERFVRAASMGAAELARRIRDDAIDVLLDASGFAEGHRLPLFQLRSAPLQATWLAYPSTTGLEAMDLRLVDGVTDPVGQAESLNTEAVVRIDPCLLAYARGGGLAGGAGEHPAPAPAERSGGGAPIAFGSFAGLQKCSEACVALWAGALERVPGSTLLLKNHGLGGERERASLLSRFERLGIAPERLVLEGPASGAAAMLAEYRRVDISLDSFPYSGTTTTCESLSMGVPMVTLSGATSASRVSASILRHAGAGELVAESPEQFVSIAAGLAGDRERRVTLRRELPGRFERTVGDGAAFARRFEAAIREQWAEACRRQGRG